jgi:hypothetical protein
MSLNIKGLQVILAWFCVLKIDVLVINNFNTFIKFKNSQL